MNSQSDNSTQTDEQFLDELLDKYTFALSKRPKPITLITTSH